MIKSLFLAVTLSLACSVVNAGQEMPQQGWWDAYALYRYLSAAGDGQVESRREVWAGMSEDQRQAAINSYRQEWLRMSFPQRKKASEDAWAWQRAHQADVPVQDGTLHDDN